MEIYLVDGTYELFRHYYALPSARDSDGCEVAAVRGVLASVLGMMKGGAIFQKFGVSPASIPDYLALVGDAADGYPGLPGWGAKSSAAVLAKFVHLESIPLDSREWRVNAANASALAATLSRERERALLFRTLATLRTDIALFDHADQLRWNGPTSAFTTLAARLDAARTETRPSVVPRSRTAPILRSAARR